MKGFHTASWSCRRRGSRISSGARRGRAVGHHLHRVLPSKRSA